VSNYFIGVEQGGSFVRLENFIPPNFNTNTKYMPLTNSDEEVKFNERSDIKNFRDNEIPDVYNTLPNIPKQQGALKDKTVWLSAGHGWLYKHNRWKTQRKNKFGLVEDFGSIEAVNHYLLKYLQNAGANVWTVRERDMNSNEVIVDDEDAGFSTNGYWAKSSSTGYNRSYRYVYSKGVASATATFTPDIPESGWYWVSTYYRNGNNRSKDTRYVVRHAGGKSVVSINQETHGLTWVYLGRFYFEKGKQGSVTLTNQSKDLNQAIIADAVRFGGGKSSVRDPEGGLSGEPRFEEAALYYTQFQGFKGEKSDVSVRPKYAEWELSKGTWTERNNACYISWHTNAGRGKGTGTETFIYNGRYTKGSPQLRKYIHQEVINDIRTDYDPNWKDRGQKSANFGELRNLRTMPGALIEIAFHDHEEDAKALKTPQFRQLTARAVYQGIVRYFAAKSGKSPVFLPEPPTHMTATNMGNNAIMIKWKAPKFGGAGGHAATGYKIYVGTHGKAFADAITLRGGNTTSYILKNLSPGTTYYFKVSATNDGGESFETQVVAARLTRNGSSKPDFLIVDGFDRLDRHAAVEQYDGDYLGTTKRHFLERMNSYDYAVDHARALENAQFSFDGATNEAVIDRFVNLRNYPAVNWFLGEESRADNTLNYKERNLVMQYLKKGGALMISGAEHAYELSRQPRGVAPSFYREYLKSAYYADDAETYKFYGVNGTTMSRIKGNLADENSRIYHVDFPDVLVPYGGAKVILKYNGGKGGAAATAYLGRDFKVVNFGFPLEGIPNENVRNQIIAKAALLLTKPTGGKALSSDRNRENDKINVVKNYEKRPQPKDDVIKPKPKVNTKAIDINSLPNPAKIGPNPIVRRFTIDISKYNSGRATFTLYKDGRRMKVVKWSHKRGRKKKLKMDRRLPTGIYDYEVNIRGEVLKGKIYRRKK
jgi:N-acetylmuramoyl-L-alanine amidase